jgi:hypothetical protein
VVHNLRSLRGLKTSLWGLKTSRWGPALAGPFVIVALLACSAACRDATDDVRLLFAGDYVFTPSEQRVIERIANDAARDARQHLPSLAKSITVRAQSGKKVIPELGAIAEPAPPDYVVWTVDPDRPEGVAKIAEAHLRAALFHEFHHLVRLTTLPAGTVIDRAILEGMATAFERDFAQANYPWGQYPDDVASWVETLLALPSDEKRTEWISQQPNGGRWITYRAGTYIVDQAMKKLGKTSAELVSTPSADILSALPR